MLVHTSFYDENDIYIYKQMTMIMHLNNESTWTMSVWINGECHLQVQWQMPIETDDNDNAFQ